MEGKGELRGEKGKMEEEGGAEEGRGDREDDLRRKTRSERDEEK